MTSRNLGLLALLLVPTSSDLATPRRDRPRTATVAHQHTGAPPFVRRQPPAPGGGAATRSRGFAGNTTRPVKFVVISDIHVTQPRSLPAVHPRVHTLIKRIVKLRPRFVAITGDFTNGGKKDIFRNRSVDRWWGEVHKILKPLRAAGIPVLPLPGNHDLAQEKHRQAYVRAWADLAGWTRPLVPRGRLPMNYSTNIDGIHLSMINFAIKGDHSEMLKWLKADLASARGSRVRLTFGHLPLRSAIASGRGPRGRFKKLAGILADNRVAAYFAGHEHLVWDETISLDAGGKRSLRQVTCGVAGAGYWYGLSSRLFKKHCKKNRWCRWPNNGRYFRVTKKLKRVPDPVSFIVGEVRGDKLSITPHVLKGGRILAYPKSPQIIRPPLPAGTRRVLILGDSHMKGTFGYQIHKAMHLRGKYDILSFGVGGAGTREYTMKAIRDWCCGYKLRRSWPRSASGKTFRHELVEYAGKRTRKVIGVEYDGSLKKVLQMFKPHAVVLILGGNATNRHQKLMDMLKADAPDAALVWVGPFKRKWYKSRYRTIKRVLKVNKRGFLVHSDDIPTLGNEELVSTHFGKKKAWLWANTAAERMDPYLKAHFKSRNKKP